MYKKFYVEYDQIFEVTGVGQIFGGGIITSIRNCNDGKMELMVSIPGDVEPESEISQESEITGGNFTQEINETDDLISPESDEIECETDEQEIIEEIESEIPDVIEMDENLIDENTESNKKIENEHDGEINESGPDIND